MATWGSGPFDSDEALDWFADVEQCSDAELPDALSVALHPTSSDDRVALAAAVLVAHGCARAVRAGAPEVDEWLAAHRPLVSRELADAAVAVIDAALGGGALTGGEVWLNGVRRALEAGPARAQVSPLSPREPGGRQGQP